MWRRKGRKRWRGDGGGGGGEKGAGKGGEKEGREEEVEQVEEPQVRGADTKNLENGLVLLGCSFCLNLFVLRVAYALGSRALGFGLRPYLSY